MKERINWQYCMRYKCEQCKYYLKCKNEEESHKKKNKIQKINTKK